MMISHTDGNGAPKKWRKVTVSDLLNDDQVERVVKIMKSTPDGTKAVEKAYRYLRKLHFPDVKGVTPRYLAYYFLYLRNQGMLDK